MEEGEALGYYFLRLDLPFSCVHALFVLWLAMYSRKLWFHSLTPPAGI